MGTLIQSITALIDNVSVTDRQEENIANSVGNLDGHLCKEDNGLNVVKTFTTGSYERDTIIRPLDDVDIFCVLKKDEWVDEYGNLPSAQSVLTKIKNFLNGLHDYKDKVVQDRPCVTIKMADKKFDVLPCFEDVAGYVIPNHDLESWTKSNPEKLAIDLDETHATCQYRLKPIIKAIKYWNRENEKLVPSYHIEETAIDRFYSVGFTNDEEGIRQWFNAAPNALLSEKFKSDKQYEDAIGRIEKTRDKINEAKQLHDGGQKSEAFAIWKEIFGKEFPVTTTEQAKTFSQHLTEGGLKINSAGNLSITEGNPVNPSKGFYGEVSKD